MEIQTKHQNLDEKSFMLRDVVVCVTIYSSIVADHVHLLMITVFWRQKEGLSSASKV